MSKAPHIEYRQIGRREWEATCTWNGRWYVAFGRSARQAGECLLRMLSDD